MGRWLHEIDVIPARELARYRRFYARHPFGLFREDLRAWVSGVLPRAKKGLKAEDVGAFLDIAVMPRQRKPKPPIDLAAKCKAIAQRQGDRVVETP